MNVRLKALIGVLALVTAACSGGDSNQAGDTTLTVSSTSTASGDAASGSVSAGPLTLTAADIDGFEKGIARETELVRAAQQRASTGATPQERGEAIQASFEINTIPAAAPATGLSAERYKLVRETLSTLLMTLDFQGKIDGPQSLDTSRADAAMKARLASDPYASLDPAGAAALKSRLDRIVPLWIEYINLTAVGG